MRTALRNISTYHWQQSLDYRGGCNGAALVGIVDILDGVEPRLSILGRCAGQADDVCIAYKSFVAGLGERYDGRIKARLCISNLLAAAERAKARIAP